MNSKSVLKVPSMLGESLKSVRKGRGSGVFVIPFLSQVVKRPVRRVALTLVYHLAANFANIAGTFRTDQVLRRLCSSRVGHRIFMSGSSSRVSCCTTFDRVQKLSEKCLLCSKSFRKVFGKCAEMVSSSLHLRAMTSNYQLRALRKIEPANQRSMLRP